MTDFAAPVDDLPEQPAVSGQDEHTRWMRLALEQAQLAVGLSEPNPRVGCVIVSGNGALLGMGHTQQAGGPHAEVMALRDAARLGNSTDGATAWVTLEPCAHHGRTPPCCDALIAAGISRVWVALEDPFDQVCGQGMARLRAAGVDVRLWPVEDAIEQAHDLNLGFFSRVQRERPWVRLKAATSLDGRTALPNGVSQWITSEAARIDGHAWRKRAGAILTGVGTVLADNPRLDVRHHECAHQPLRVVLDSRLRTPAHARLFELPSPVLLYATEPAEQAEESAKAEFRARRAALEARGAEITLLGPSPGASGSAPEVGAVLKDLARRGVNELHVEAGHTLNAALLQGAWVDELLVYMAARLLGHGAGLAALPVYETLAQAPAFEFFEATVVGADLRLRARVRQG